jgi:hypothetical protein
MSWWIHLNRLRAVGSAVPSTQWLIITCRDYNRWIFIEFYTIYLQNKLPIRNYKFIGCFAFKVRPTYITIITIIESSRPYKLFEYLSFNFYHCHNFCTIKNRCATAMLPQFKTLLRTIYTLEYLSLNFYHCIWNYELKMDSSIWENKNN